MSSRRAFALCAAAWLGFGLDAAPARADGPSPAANTVSLVVPDCLGVSGEQVRKLVSLELAPRLRVTALSDAPLRGSVTCGDGAVMLTVEDRTRAAPLRVELDLAAAAPPARTRLLALSLAELIATSRLEHTPDGARAVADATGNAGTAASSEGASEAAATSSPARDVNMASARVDGASAPDTSSTAASDGWHLWIAPAMSRAGAPALTLLGVDAGGARSLGGWAVLADVQARWGERTAPDAELSLRALSASAALAPSLALGAFVLAAGAGVRAGHVELAAHARRDDLRGDALSGLWFGPMAIATAQAKLLPPGALRLAFEVGYVAHPVVGLDQGAQDLIALRGIWFSAALGFALALP